MNRHIYLSGFMGTGKTTIGRLLARRLGRPFIDTDQAIEAKFKMTVAQIFAQRGEPFFRAQERALLRQLGALRPHVVGLGGGIALDAANRAVLRQGLWVNLNASPAVIMKRTAGSKKRPLLQGPNKRQTIDNLLNGRRPYYLQAPVQLDTDGLHPAAAAEKLAKMLIP